MKTVQFPEAAFSRTRRAWRNVARVACLTGVLALSACWWDDDPLDVSITGIAATGAPIVNGEVKVVNARGESVFTRTDSTGSYTVSIGEAPPYALSVADSTGKVWYSYAAGAGTAHITPLTTLAMLDANANKPLAELVNTWATKALNEAQVIKSATTLNANLRSLMSGAGLDPNAVNVFTAPNFAANRTGLDAVLDAMRVSLDCSPSACTQRITSPSGSVLVDWRGDIATTGITLSWTATDGTATAAGTGGTTGAAVASGSITVGLGSCKAAQAGTWSMVVQTSVSGLAGLPIPEVCIDGLPGAPTSQDEFCGSDTTKGQLPAGVQIVSCSFSGNTGRIDARITSPIVVDYAVTYSFVRR